MSLNLTTSPWEEFRHPPHRTGPALDKPNHRGMEADPLFETWHTHPVCAGSVDQGGEVSGRRDFSASRTVPSRKPGHRGKARVALSQRPSRQTFSLQKMKQRRTYYARGSGRIRLMVCWGWSPSETYWTAGGRDSAGELPKSSPLEEALAGFGGSAPWTMWPGTTRG